MAEGWTTTTQRQTTQITAGGRFEDVLEIHFTTDRGMEGSVRVPLSKLTPDEVYNRISAQVAVLHAIDDL